MKLNTAPLLGRHMAHASPRDVRGAVAAANPAAPLLCLQMARAPLSDMRSAVAAANSATSLAELEAAVRGLALFDGVYFFQPAGAADRLWLMGALNPRRTAAQLRQAYAVWPRRFPPRLMVVPSFRASAAGLEARLRGILREAGAELPGGRGFCVLGKELEALVARLAGSRARVGEPPKWFCRAAAALGARERELVAELAEPAAAPSPGAGAGELLVCRSRAFPGACVRVKAEMLVVLNRHPATPLPWRAAHC